MNEIIKTVSDAVDVFGGRLINQCDPTQIEGFFDELKEAGVFADRKYYYSRLKKKFQKAANKAKKWSTTCKMEGEGCSN